MRNYTLKTIHPTADKRTVHKSHYSKAEFNSIVFGKSIRLRLLNQRKEDDLANLNRLNEKAERSNVALDMKNDMLGMAPKWEENVRPLKWKKKMTTRLSCIVSHMKNGVKKQLQWRFLTITR